jgi:hypothetical protein
MTQKVQETPCLELLAPTTYCNVNFRFKSETQHSTNTLNNINLSAREEIYKEGTALFNYCYIDDMLSIRYTLTNPEVKETDLDFLLNTFVEKCQNLEKLA